MFLKPFAGQVVEDGFGERRVRLRGDRDRARVGLHGLGHAVVQDGGDEGVDADGDVAGHGLGREAVRAVGDDAVRLERAERDEDGVDLGRDELAELLPAEQGHLPRRRRLGRPFGRARLGPGCLRHRSRGGDRRAKGYRCQDRQDLFHVNRLLARPILSHPAPFGNGRRSERTHNYFP